MIMNTISISKIVKLFSNYLVEHKKNSLIAIGITIFVALISGFYYDSESYFTGLAIFLFFMLMNLASSIYSPLKNSRSKISYLMIPASTLEKSIANLFTVHIFQIVTLFCATLIGLFLGNGIGYLLDPYADIISFIPHHSPLTFSAVFSIFNGDMFLFLILFQSIMVFGSILFKRSAFIKTMGSLILFFIIIIIIGVIMSVTLLVNLINADVNTFALESSMIDILLKNDGVIEIVGVTYYLITLFAFWVMSFFKLRETEV